jgi:hypothetical protein
MSIRCAKATTGSRGSRRAATSDPRNLNDIFVTHKVDGVWTEPVMVPRPISTNEGNEHCPMLLRDGKTLCFASMRAGGYGASDIWCSRQDASGDWQEPVNQGPSINTAANEFHFMEGTDGWVYFSSGRPGGHGGMDIWASHHEAATSGPDAWSTPVNLGPSVNTPDTDICPALPPDGETLTWFSYRTDNTLGPSDIFWAAKPKLEPPR